MSYFHEEQKVKEYIAMCEGYDGEELINILRENLIEGARVLELGMGPGKDLDILQRYYRVTGSDYSEIFLNTYKETNPHADLLLVDAIEMNVANKFQGIFSNKVLQHLTREELRESIEKQSKVLIEPGIVLHSFWYGDKKEEIEGLKFVYYNEATLREVFSREFEIIEMNRYCEIEDEDSIYVVAKKRACV
ncbi:class I SAM-dependent methyltransferase [Oceanirhabdus sp. W0125-5]|uniref:class I SAM-dependent methyltransferase n=1 Tax=Oceanirhabdus sp. W0125-5 TaxID=2999116 RepID=UPI0022F2C769|nr:class I SAM-dependent methyltransferase [Oceanirhabdus sp. W0125-5]WBW97810.1 class I SAM-dependent methyltransferase [Oceanirhabdus sp. W0125-5]